MVLAMSPIGEAFRNRLRQFPSLVNCCTIDWFQVSYIAMEEMAELVGACGSANDSLRIVEPHHL